MYTTFLFDPNQFALFSTGNWLPSRHTLTIGTPQISEKDSHAAVVHDRHPSRVAESFDYLADTTSHMMLSHDARPLEVPDIYAQRASLNGRFRLTAHAWSIQHCTGPAHLRMVRIDGAQSQIINSWIFPSDPRQRPVFAAELIGVGDKLRVAFVDIQQPVDVAIRNDFRLHLADIAQRYRNLPCDESAPDWAIAASLGSYTYSRNVGLNALADIELCYLDYLRAYLGAEHPIDESLPAEQNLESARSQLHEYQLHHMHSSPGHKFLGNLFGVEWTERFMLDFLFTLP